MSEIAKLYNDVMAGVEAEKLAADHNAEDVAHDINEEGGVEIDAEFFHKVANGDEEAVEVMNNFIEEARAEGASDEEIEEAINEAMGDAEGGEDQEVYEEVDELEVQKAAAYYEGAETAVFDALDSELAKVAGVTIDDLVEYELGSHYGTGYAETRSELDAVIEKIATVKYEQASPASLLMKMAKEQQDKKMSGAAKAGIGAAGAAGAGALALGALAKKKGLGFNPMAGGRMLRTGAGYAKDSMKGSKGMLRGDRLRSAGSSFGEGVADRAASLGSAMKKAK